jgi:hypothetical protein
MYFVFYNKTLFDPVSLFYLSTSCAAKCTYCITGLVDMQQGERLRPQSTQSAGAVRSLIFCSISIFPSLVVGRKPQCNADAD